MIRSKTFLHRTLGLLLVLAVLLPLAGNSMVVESSAVTQAEIDALKGDAGDLASQRKEIQAQIKALKSDKEAALAKRDLLVKQIYVVQQEINNINKQLEMYDQLIAEKTAAGRCGRESPVGPVLPPDAEHGGTGGGLLLVHPVFLQQLRGTAG